LATRRPASRLRVPQQIEEDEDATGDREANRRHQKRWEAPNREGDAEIGRPPDDVEDGKVRPEGERARAPLPRRLRAWLRRLVQGSYLNGSSYDSIFVAGDGGPATVAAGQPARQPPVVMVSI